MDKMYELDFASTANLKKYGAKHALGAINHFLIHESAGVFTREYKDELGNSARDYMNQTTADDVLETLSVHALKYKYYKLGNQHAGVLNYMEKFQQDPTSLGNEEIISVLGDIIDSGNIDYFLGVVSTYPQYLSVLGEHYVQRRIIEDRKNSIDNTCFEKFPSLSYQYKDLEAKFEQLKSNNYIAQR